MKSSDQTKHQFWQRHVKQFLASGLKQVQYCKQHGLSVHQVLDVNYLVRFATTILAGCHIIIYLIHLSSPFFSACFLRKLSP